LRAPGRAAGRGPARGRLPACRRRRRRARRPAQLLDQPRRRRRPPRRLAARHAPARPAFRFPGRTGRLAGRGPDRARPPHMEPPRMNLPDCYATGATGARPLHVVDRTGLEAWRAAQPAATAAWCDAHAFDAAAGSCLVLPASDGQPGAAVIGVGDRLDPCAYGHAPRALPAGDWAPADGVDGAALRALQLGWGLGSYDFHRYRKPRPVRARLAVATPDDETLAVLAAVTRVRDLVNTPTQDMGAEELEAVARGIAGAHGARFEAITGDALLALNFPAIHAVGRASHRAPRLLVLRWGEDAHPHVALVGKGVCFDTGGLDLKPADGMRNMKKDMGGAAHALALAELVMARRLPLRLTLLVPAVENAVGPDAFRPGEVVATRTGVTVEIDNTDAEGRVI